MAGLALLGDSFINISLGGAHFAESILGHTDATTYLSVSIILFMDLYTYLWLNLTEYILNLCL